MKWVLLGARWNRSLSTSTLNLFRPTEVISTKSTDGTPVPSLTPRLSNFGGGLNGRGENRHQDNETRIHSFDSKDFEKDVKRRPRKELMTKYPVG